MLRTFAASLFAILYLATAPAAQTRVPLDGTWQIAADASPTPPAQYAHQCAVPAAFESVLGNDFDGVAWYRRPLRLLPEWRDAAVRVEFAAAMTHARVFCNGSDCGEHLGGWTPFSIDVTKALRWDGSDELAVRVDELVGHNTQGFLPIIQPHFGGLWQSVTLCVAPDASFARSEISTFGRWLAAAGNGELIVRLATLPPPAGAATDKPLAVGVDVLDGSRVVATGSCALDPAGRGELTLPVTAIRAWSPTAPHLYRCRLSLRRGNAVVDVLERRVGFRSLRANGTTVLWNERPLAVRGILHWGFSPPRLAPLVDEASWRRQLEDFRSLGFNTLKCCLFVPPPCVYELCDELGLLCWQEYPTWHSSIDAAHRDELVREYAEFHRLDGGHASVAFRSITCETGHGADLEVVKALFDGCHALVPDTLVVDDSSWIGWQRITDFWDEHPYGNNRWWPDRLETFRRHIEEHGKKPLLLGECIAADTWVDLGEWQRRAPGTPPWWRPDCLTDQLRFEQAVAGEFGREVLATLAPTARDYGLRTRRYQIERLRRTLPDAGYVVSVARDIPKARMGLYDDFDRLKWTPADFAWQRDDLLALDTDRRAFVVGAAGVQLAARAVRTAPPGASQPQVSPPLPLPPLPIVKAPTRVRVEAKDHELAAAWDLWALPPFAAELPIDVEVADHLDQALLDRLVAGARVLLRVGGRERSLFSEPMWYLRGAPWAPPHPVHAALPLAMLVELQPFDLDGGRVMPWTILQGQVDPILAFWETHDIAEVRSHLFAFDTRVGLGRLLASAFDTTSDAGRYVETMLARHLATGRAPQRELAPTTIAALRDLLGEHRLPLPKWRFRTDADDKGLGEQWFSPTTDTAAAPWRDLAAGSHWENQAEDLKQYTGVAWYRVDVEIPTDWPDVDARAVFEGVDDSFELWLDGESLGRRGDPATKTTIWLEPQVLELGRRLRPGRHTLTLRVVDHAGSGGLWKPASITTGPVGEVRRLLQ